MATAEEGSILASDTTLPPPTRARTAATATAATAEAGAAVGTPTTRRRAKSFLRNYYGIQQTNLASQDGPKESTSAQPGPVTKADPYDLGTGSWLLFLIQILFYQHAVGS